MPKTLIEQNPTFTKKVEGEDKLAIAEFFCDTIQGEGIHTGVPATFLRLQGCTLQCNFCDTLTVWPNGNEYAFKEVFDLMDSIDLPDRLSRGQHLVITGGSPLKQQNRVIRFIEQFIHRYGFLPFIEIENEAVLVPMPELVPYIACWNNSPKLNNSGMRFNVRIKPDALITVASLPNSYFKFVVSSEEDWSEIAETFLETGYIKREQIVLMPEGQTQEALLERREMVVAMAIKKGVRFSDRLHITIWNKQTGV